MSQSVANIHDAFCKQALGDPGRAKQFLREHLPLAIAALLSDQPPELLPVSFVDEGLRQHHSDLLFRVGLKTGGEAFVYMLIEHKSAPDPLARLQLLRYIIRILMRWVEERREAKLPVLPLPPVIPLLVHHGPNGWSASTDFADLFGPVPDALRPYLPQFHHALVDLIGIPDSELSVDAALRMRLKAMKYALWPDLVRRLEVILADAGTLDDVDVVAVLIYIMSVKGDIGEAAVREALRRIAPSRTEEFMSSWVQAYINQGEAKGKADGLIEGEAKMLLRQLQRRFGEVRGDVVERIRSAKLEQLDEWGDRFVDARTLEDIFGADRRH